MSRKAYRVELTEADRTWLLEFIGRGAAPTREQTRARVLLKADQGRKGRRGLMIGSQMLLSYR
jgi:hypothetical protein